MTRPNYDVFGHCVKCHRNLLIQEVIDGKVAQRFHPDHGHVEYLLDDGSRMRVCMCQPCQSILDDSDETRDAIMHCVIDGWKHEVETYSHWDESKKREYINEYFKKKLIVKSDRMPKDHLDKKLKEFKDKRGKNGSGN